VTGMTVPMTCCAAAISSLDASPAFGLEDFLGKTMRSARYAFKRFAFACSDSAQRLRRR
jgi:hypothetical protein